jgi:uncharacterized repeat protein (TIGR01451 family)
MLAGLVLTWAAAVGLTGLVLPTTASGVLITSKVTVSATQPPVGLLPGNSATSTITVANSGTTTVARTRVTVTPPTSSANGPTFAVSAAAGVACSALQAGSIVQVCTVGTLTPGYSEPVATITGTPPAKIGLGVSTSVQVASPANTVSVTWQWGLPRLVTRVTLSPSTIELGQSITGTLTVTNAGNGTAPGFITDTPLPGGLDTLISQTPGTSCIPYDTDLWCPMGGLPPRASNKVVWSFEPRRVVAPATR